MRNKEIRIYACIGVGRTYQVNARSNAAAKLLAGRLYKEEIEGPYPLGFYAMYFDARILEPKPPGKLSDRVLPEVGELVRVGGGRQ